MIEEKNEQNKMSEEKFKRVVVAITVGAVLLFTILLSIMVFQIVSIFCKRSEIKGLKRDIEIYEELIQDEEKKLQAVSLKEYIINEAKKLEYKLPTDLT